MPVKRLGLDMRGYLLTAVDLIDRRRRGVTVPDVTWIEAVWEEELPAASRAAAL
jgi:hypothetical protein